ncbi:MAG TPA: hypothetical protein VGM51_18940 [Armatimonadota bacterium]
MKHLHWSVFPLGISLVAGIAVSAAGRAGAQGVPSTFTYQGYVTNSAGKPLPDGSNAMQFRLFSMETGGTALWDSGAMNVGVQRGVFAVVLGASPTPPVSSATLSSPDIWLEVRVGADTLLPRTKLTSSPFAMRAADLALPFSKTVPSPSAPAFNVANSGANYGIRGESSNASFAGVMGENTGAGMGVYAASKSGQAVRAWQQDSFNTAALADSNGGVSGSSGVGYGVSGFSTTGTGVRGESTDGPGIYGKSTHGHAGYFDGYVSVLNQGNVGIGLEYANHRLYVLQNQGGLAGALKLDNPNSSINNSGVGIKFSVGGDGTNGLLMNRTKGALMYSLADTWNRGDFHFLQNSAANDTQPDISHAVLTIKNNGRIGIGVTSPGAKLEVSDLMRVEGATWPTTGKGLELGYSPTLNRGYVQAYDRATSIWGDLYLGDGRVGIGAPAPTAKLDVRGDASVSGNLTVTGAMLGNIGPAGGSPFPRPAYDTGWFAQQAATTLQYIHNIGGDVNHYVVELLLKKPDGGITNQDTADSIVWDPNQNKNVAWGAYWHDLTTSTISVTRESVETFEPILVRVRIWVYN